MVKKLLFIFILFITTGKFFAQQELPGKIEVDSLLDAPVHVINLTKRLGVVTTSRGNFKIKAAQGDTLMISSVQYETRKILITSEILTNNFLNVQLKDNIQQLDEVRLTELTGRLALDIDKIKVVPVPTSFHVPVIPMGENAMPTRPANAAMGSSIGNSSGVNFMSLAKSIFSDAPKKPDDKLLWHREAITQIKQRFSTDFFTEYLKIEKKYIVDFLEYSLDHGLSKNLLKAENGLKLVAFMERISKRFLKETSENG